MLFGGFRYLGARYELLDCRVVGGHHRTLTVIISENCSVLARDLSMLLFGVLDMTARLTKLLFHVPRTMAHDSHLPAVLGEFLLQITTSVALVSNC